MSRACYCQVLVATCSERLQQSEQLLTYLRCILRLCFIMISEIEAVVALHRCDELCEEGKKLEKEGKPLLAAEKYLEGTIVARYMWKQVRFFCFQQYTRNHAVVSSGMVTECCHERNARRSKALPRTSVK